MGRYERYNSSFVKDLTGIPLGWQLNDLRIFSLGGIDFTLI